MARLVFAACIWSSTFGATVDALSFSKPSTPGDSASRSKAFLAVDTRPDAAARSLVAIEDAWQSEAAGCVDRHAASYQHGMATCFKAPEAFQKSCGEVVSALMQGSSGSKDATEKYLDDVCRQNVLKDWHKTRCNSLADSIASLMTGTRYMTRVQSQTGKLCSNMWFDLVHSEKNRVSTTASETARLSKAKAEQEIKIRHERKEDAKSWEKTKARSEEHAKAKAAAEAKAKAELEANVNRTVSKAEAKLDATAAAMAKEILEAKALAKAKAEAKAKARAIAKANALAKALAKAKAEAKVKAEAHAGDEAKAMDDIKQSLDNAKAKIQHLVHVATCRDSANATVNRSIVIEGSHGPTHVVPHVSNECYELAADNSSVTGLVVDGSHGPTLVISHKAKVASADNASDNVFVINGSHGPTSVMSHNVTAVAEHVVLANSTANSTHEPIVLANSTHEPIVSTVSRHEPIVLTNSTHEPIVSTNSTHEPIVLTNSTHAPIVPTNSTHKPIVSTNSTHEPTVFQPNSTSASHLAVAKPANASTGVAVNAIAPSSNATVAATTSNATTSGNAAMSAAMDVENKEQKEAGDKAEEEALEAENENSLYNTTFLAWPQ
jgi:hypothetical protein